LRRLEEEASGDAPYDLAVLDLCMPGMDGLELAGRISRIPALASVGLVLLTSGPDVSPAEATEAGISARLTKPVHLSRLRTALEGVSAAACTRGPAATPLPGPPPVGSRGHVLVVEDNHVNQLVAVGILEHLGYSTEVAGNGIEALTAVAQRTFDAVLMDCQMPELDGYAATEELRRTEAPGRRTPVIAMTAGVSQGERERCRAAGMDDFVPKPVSPDALDTVLARWLPTSAPDGPAL
jgi:CheY-like chemotaxis protein